MRTTAVLNATHIGRLIREKWWRSGKLKFEKCCTRRALAENNIKLYEYSDLEPKPLILQERHPYFYDDLPLDENHPDYKSETCYIYRDNDVLVEGIDQAKILANCEEITQLPQSLIDAENQLDLPETFMQEAQRRIMQSCVFDAHQEKLPRRKDPERPAYKFPRDYGITDVRKNNYLLNNLVQLCDQYSMKFNKLITSDRTFISPMRAFGKLIQLEMTADVVRSSQPLPALKETDNLERIPVPDIYPSHCSISIKPYNFYTEKNAYGFRGTSFPYVQTAFFSFNRTEVTNIFEEPVTDSQMLARNLMKGFAVASSQARALYGDDVKELKEPIVIQIVMINEGNLHFSVLQLNSLDVDNEKGKKNIYWNSPIVKLYTSCKYDSGIPRLMDFDPNVMKRLMAFYASE